MEGGAHAAPTHNPEVVLAEVSVAPIERSPIPVGTVAELTAQGLDPSEYATCAKPNKMLGIVGCPFHDKCRVAAKGESGPRNYGVQVIKGPAFGGKLVRNTVDCMWLAQQIDDIEDNKGSVQVLAQEGETYEKVTSVLVDNNTNEISTNPHNPNARREERRVAIRVPAWPRPGENKELLHDMLRAETAQIEKERRSDENLTRNLGLGNAVAPLDKRDEKRPRGGKA